MKGKNNPGNIRVGAGKFIGEEPSSGAFRNFSSLAYGYRAIMKIFQSYHGKGYNTLRKALNRYAPPSDNNPTNAYIDFLAKKLNISPDADLLPIISSPRIWELAGYISAFEQGKGFQNDENALKTAYSLTTGTPAPLNIDNSGKIAVVAGLVLLGYFLL